MSKPYIGTMCQTAWEIPCVRLKSDKGLFDEVYDFDACIEFQCRIVHKNGRVVVVNGKDCQVTAQISTYHKVAKGSRIVFSAEDKASRDINLTKRVGSVTESVDMLSNLCPLYRIDIV